MFNRKEVEYMNMHIGKFLNKLEKSGLMEKTIIVIFGDYEKRSEK
jgi:phosphoglycerol transferase MdoB-like AlkP superfamily enzyme